MLTSLKVLSKPTKLETMLFTCIQQFNRKHWLHQEENNVVDLHLKKCPIAHSPNPCRYLHNVLGSFSSSQQMFLLALLWFFPKSFGIIFNLFTWYPLMHTFAQRWRKVKSLTRCLLATLAFCRCIQFFQCCCHADFQNHQTINGHHISRYQ